MNLGAFFAASGVETPQKTGLFASIPCAVLYPENLVPGTIGVHLIF
jgi:hypothetical protein